MANLVYDYIAQSNPALATRVLSDFNYVRTKNSQGLGNDLRVLVSKEGEPALEAIMQIHPDKEIIIDLFSPTKPKAKKCTTCASNAYSNASGPSGGVSGANALSAQGNTFILAAALMLAVAIIVKH